MDRAAAVGVERAVTVADDLPSARWVGDAAMARECVDAGYVLSFAGPVTFKNAPTLREAAALVPDDRLLVETDAPFLTPHPHRGRANEPFCLPWTVRALAVVRDVTDER